MAARRPIGEAGWGWTLGAGIVSLIYFFPVLWIILTAFKTHTDALAVPPVWFFTPTLENFVQVFNRVLQRRCRRRSTPASPASSSTRSSSPAPRC